MMTTILQANKPDEVTAIVGINATTVFIRTGPNTIDLTFTGDIWTMIADALKDASIKRINQTMEALNEERIPNG